MRVVGAGRSSVSRRAARLVAVRLVPVRRTEARVDAGSGWEGRDCDGAGANGRSLLVRVPVAERLFVVAPAAAGGVVPAGDEDFAGVVGPAGVVGVLALPAGGLADADFFVPAPADPVPAAAPLVGAGRADAARVVLVLAGFAVLFWADVEGFVVGLSALMEQRYAVFAARRESDPVPVAHQAGRRTGLPRGRFRGPRGTRAVHFPALWASWAGPSRSSWSSL